ncbi:acetylornithine deacetylase/succinyl-diaminopimelate desuccinylase-like protein [Mycobacterium frederiksbergense]|uniref:Acetylornithine deacetylase/succinyl-diaminopimelate desuccinylase-like protein n=1 Tax=Mycolicibacterium frederiksbergense TaxID=117567 RepID=A0ABT6KTS3_9MYCO|nr:M20/M25/M40 family metallo-hydrolase [Mycolicibacterium frederiksbergense]MDH6194122.1 acetylornithine deacetylase/succinyl-diaminopimelate desuccinylase-like protein [Mycolicibacterium frederiksbergense]
MTTTARDQRRPLDVTELAQQLIRIDTSNPGGAEKPAAQLVADALGDMGVSVEWFEPEPGRCSLVARFPGLDPNPPPLLIHAHLDVVPAVAADWTRDPFGGDLHDGYIWGRGAVDMKGMVAMTLSALSRMHHDGRRPRRDLVLAFFADEEAGGELGAGHVTRTRPDLFADCREAIGEVGGFSHTLNEDTRAYFVSTAEKGVWWARLVAEGTAGHASMINPNNPVALLADAVSRIAAHTADTQFTATTTAMFDRLRDILGVDASDDDLLQRLGPLNRMVRAGLRNTVNPTELKAGYKTNVVPGIATGTIDARFLPHNEQTFRAELARLAGDRIRIEHLYSGPALEAEIGTSLLDAIGAALRTEDDIATVLPYMSTAFTDAKWLSPLGINCYGFAPMLLPDDLDFTALFHGVDERLPVSALHFGVRVLEELLTVY